MITKHNQGEKESKESVRIDVNLADPKTYGDGNTTSWNK